jgi:DNA-binding beta-propeller fold protein YncE
MMRMVNNEHRRLLTALGVVLTVIGCGTAADLPSPQSLQGAQGTRRVAAAPARFYTYVTAQDSNKILVIDTSTNVIVKRLAHADLVQPANGKFHPSKKRFYAGGVGKITVWDTTDLANAVYLKTLTPQAGSTGEYRGVAVYKGSTTAIDGDVYFSNVADAKVYVYRAADIEGSNPMPVKVFDSTSGLVRPHYLALRPNSNEVWIGNRPSQVNGTLLRFNGDTRSVITTPTATLETTNLPGDEPNEIAFSKDGALAYVGHHGNTFTGSPANSNEFSIVDTATFTVKKNVSLAPGYDTPGYVDVDADLGRVYFCSKWPPAVVVLDTMSERVLRYVELGGYGPCYSVALTPDKRYIYAVLGNTTHAPTFHGQGAVVAIDARTLIVTANIVDTDLLHPRNAAFPY